MPRKSSLLCSSWWGWEWIMIYGMTYSLWLVVGLHACFHVWFHAVKGFCIIHLLSYVILLEEGTSSDVPDWLCNCVNWHLCSRHVVVYFIWITWGYCIKNWLKQYPMSCIDQGHLFIYLLSSLHMHNFKGYTNWDHLFELPIEARDYKNVSEEVGRSSITPCTGGWRYTHVVQSMQAM